ncbi:MAG: sugar phosphate isomerase/epimerase [Clostridia bacterium]|nr:sugar phosphate isomerase/epimerase [Clostridia bacterium]
MELTNYSSFTRDWRNRGIDYAIEHSAELGFTSVEFIDMYNSQSMIPDALDADHVNRLLKKHGMHVACYSMGVPLHHNMEKNLQNVLRQVDMAAKLGSPFFHHTVTLMSVGREEMIPIEDMLACVLPSLKEIANRCAEHGITTLYEPQGAYFNGIAGIDLLLRTMRDEGCPNLGFCADVGNSREVDELASLVFAHFKNDIRHVHLKDYVLTDVAPKGIHYYTSRKGTYMYDCEIGTGNIEFKECFDVLRQIGYNASFSFECTCDDESMRRSISYIKNLWENQ